MVPSLALKVDVDTLKGFREGLPALLEILELRGIKASFFVALGPDNSGRAFLRLFRQKGFWEKMWRTRAPALYGLKTLSYGVLVPGPVIGRLAPHILPALTAAGHEVGLHGFNHVRWHDKLFKMTAPQIELEINAAQKLFTAALSQPAQAFAAPGWQCSAVSKKILAAQGFLYASDTRGTTPFWPQFGAQIIPLLDLPTTLPTLDELLGFNGCRPRDFSRLILARLETKTPQVLTIHAELEGGPYRREFAWLLDRALEQGVTFFRLQDWARQLLQRPQEIPVASVVQGRLPGRAGRLALQAPREKNK